VPAREGQTLDTPGDLVAIGLRGDVGHCVPPEDSGYARFLVL
jgi:hypothetical protein